MVRRSIFDQIFKEMQNIRFRLDDLENTMANWNPQPMEIRESELMTLPDHLRKTYIIIASKGECSAIQVSNLTGRCRAIESNYLNQLARMGWLNKRRISKTTHFRTVPKRVFHKTEEPLNKEISTAMQLRDRVQTRQKTSSDKKNYPVELLYCEEEEDSQEQ